MSWKDFAPEFAKIAQAELDDIAEATATTWAHSWEAVRAEYNVAECHPAVIGCASLTMASLRIPCVEDLELFLACMQRLLPGRRTTLRLPSL